MCLRGAWVSERQTSRGQCDVRQSAVCPVLCHHPFISPCPVHAMWQSSGSREQYAYSSDTCIENGVARWWTAAGERLLVPVPSAHVSCLLPAAVGCAARPLQTFFSLAGTGVE